MADIDFEFDAPPDDTPTLVLGKKKKKKKPKPENEDVASGETADSSSLSELLAKKKKKKKKPLELDVDDGVVAEEGESYGKTLPEAEDTLDGNASQEPVADDDMSLSSKKKKKKKKSRLEELAEISETGEDLSVPLSGAFSSFGLEEGEKEDDTDSAHVSNGTRRESDFVENVPGDSADVVAGQPKKPGKKKGKGKKQPGTEAADEDLDSILAELGENPDLAVPQSSKGAAGEADDESLDLKVGVSSVSSKKKKAKKKGQGKQADDDDLDALLAELDEKPKPHSSDATKAEPSQVAGGADDIEDMMAELDAPPSSSNSKKKKGKNKGSAKPADDDDLDALLAELGDTGKPVTSQAESAQAESAPAPEGNDPADDVDALMAELNEEDGGGLSAAAAKRKKKKAKKSGAKAEESTSNDTSTAASSSKKGGKKESLAVRKLREQQERKAAEEARLAKLREEEEERRLEEERIEKEKEEVRERARLAKREAEKARKARLKAEGKLLTKAEAAKRRKAEAFKQQMIAQGLVPAVNSSTSGADESAAAQTNTGRVVYSSRKRNRGKPQAESQSAGSGDMKASEPASLEDSSADVKPDDVKEPAKPLDTPADQPVVPQPDVEVPEEWDADLGAAADLHSKDTTKDVLSNETSSGKMGKQDGRKMRDRISGQTQSSDSGKDGSESSSDSESGSGSDSDCNGMSRAEVAAEKRRDKLRRSRVKEAEAARAARTPDVLRSPIVCILGHVDTGKTKILDRIRRTNVQDGEAGGITQQIGATYFPIEAVKKETSKIDDGRDIPYNVPSLLIIDTPGHESFTNLRSRGSSLCDIAILVVDIMHGLEPQTRESIDLLKLRRTPFIVALNKVDRLYKWNTQKGNCPIRKSLAAQDKDVHDEFARRLMETKGQLASVGFNTELYWENDNVRRTVSIVPTSAITGEGIPDLLMLLLELPQKLLLDRLMYNPILEATVLEVKVIEGLGTTIDIVLTGGVIRAGDTIFVVGLDGPIQTTIRALLTPHPMKEMRVKGQYLHHKEIRAAQGIKISADGLDKAVAGTQLLVARDSHDDDELEYLRDEVMKEFTTILQNVDKSGVGVYVQASTLGSLEALLEFLRTSEVPVAGINIGPVHKKDIVKASTMLERHKEYAVVLAFDIPVEKEARALAEDIGVIIFTADIIYNLFDMFTEHLERCKRSRREDVNDDVVFPCVLTILQEHVYRKKSPLVLGVTVAEGILRVGCPLVVQNGNEWLNIGRAVSMELNKKSVQIAKRGESVALKVYSSKTEHIMYGRHFDWTNKLVSKMSRNAINILKDNFREDLSTDDWRLVVKMKSWFDII